MQHYPEMTSNRKKPGVAFWATAAVVVVVLYVISCPIVYRIGDTGLLSDQARSVADKIYWPIRWILDEIFGGNC